MFSNPDLIIYLWLFPIALILIIPLALASANLPLTLLRTFFRNPSKSEEHEKRQHPRVVSPKDTVAEISVNGTTYTALVCNISRFGIQLKNLPEKLSHEIDKLTITVKQYGIIGHDLIVRPKWMLLTDSGYQLGAEIADAPAGWGDYILQTERTHQSY